MEALVRHHQVDEGWVISPRRISPAAYQASNIANNIFCYTFDELLDESVDFNPYFAWLEEQVVSRGIDTKYIPLAAKKNEYDLLSGELVGVSKYDKSFGWLDTYIDQWLDDPTKEHISILGEFGTGKTWFSLHYAWIALKKYLRARERKTARPRIPIFIPLRDYAKAVSVESLFSEFFFRKHEIPLPGYSAFVQLNRMGKLLLIFDGFDEMASRIDRQQMINNYWELTKVVVPGSKAILSCRTEHFPTEKESKELLSAKLKASTLNLTGISPQFEIVELEKLTTEQIRELLEMRGAENSAEKILDDPKLLALAQRPVLIDFILEALPEIEQGKTINTTSIYLYAIQRKIERDIKDERTFTSMRDKVFFLAELSWDMMLSDQLTLNYRQFPDKLRAYFGNRITTESDLDNWQYDMMGQTLLNRDVSGNYAPAHRSLLEWFVAFKFSALMGTLDKAFLQILREDSALTPPAEPKVVTWNEYFGLAESGNTHIAIEGFLKTPIDEEQEQLPALTYAIAQFMYEMTSRELIATLPKLSEQSFLKITLDKLQELTTYPVKQKKKQDATQLIHDLLLQTMRLIRGDKASIYILIGSELVLWWNSEANIDASHRFISLNLDARSGVQGRAVRHNTIQLVNDVTMSPDYIQTNVETRSQMAAPIMLQDRVIGVFNIDSAVQNMFQETDVQLIQYIIASICSPLLTSIAGFQEFWLEQGYFNTAATVAALTTYGLETSYLESSLNTLLDNSDFIDKLRMLIDKR